MALVRGEWPPPRGRGGEDTEDGRDEEAGVKMGVRVRRMGREAGGSEEGLPCRGNYPGPESLGSGERGSKALPLA